MGDTLHGKPWEDLDTNPPGDWAETRAREWLTKNGDDLSIYSHALSHNRWVEAPRDNVESLAALLREVANTSPYAMKSARQLVLAEVRRVVLDVRARSVQPTAGCADAPLVCEEILARLERL